MFVYVCVCERERERKRERERERNRELGRNLTEKKKHNFRGWPEKNLLR